MLSKKEKERIQIVQDAAQEFVQILAQKQVQVEPKVIEHIIKSTSKYLQTKGITVKYPGLK